MNSRQKYILKLVNERGRISVNELAQFTEVSLVTIRNDLSMLDRKKYLVRLHGSALALESSNIGVRIQQRFDIKKSIAEYALSLIKNGETIYIDGGSTNAFLAERLEDKENLTVITSNQHIAGLLRYTSHSVIMLGGLLQRESESLVGPLTRADIQQVHFHKAFLGIDGWHPTTGFTSNDMMRCDVNSTILAKNIETVALADSSKFGVIHPYPLLSAPTFSRVITDNELLPKYRQFLNENNIQVNLV